MSEKFLRFMRQSRYKFMPSQKEALKNIWSQNSRGDIRRLERKKGSRFLKILGLVILFFALLAGISWLGFFLTSGKNQSEGVSLNIDGPTEVINFSEMEIKISYQNKDFFPLANAALALQYPEEIQIIETEPKSDNESFSRWTLGSLGAQKEGFILIKGRIIGNIDSKMRLQATLTYRPANFNADFQTVKNLEILIKDSPLNISLESQLKELAAGEPLELDINYKPEENEIIFPDNLRLLFDFPQEFLIEKTEPENIIIENSVAIDNPDKEQTIKIIGAFAPEAEGDYEMSIKAILIKQDKISILKETKQSVKIIKNNLNLRLFVNERAENQQIKLGDNLLIRLDLDNQSLSAVKNLKLRLSSDSALINWESVEGENKGEIKDNLLTWDKNNFPQLEEIKSGGKISLNFKVNLKDSANSQVEPRINLAAGVLIEEIGGRQVNLETKSQAIELRVGSNLKVSSKALFYANDKTPLGEGAWPPEVGKETVLRLIWRLDNSFHELKDIKISAELPANIRFEEKKIIEAGSITFNPENRVIEWKINRLPLGVKSLEAQFKISFVPSEEERGQLLLLLSETTAEAFDSALQSLIAARAPSLTSNLESDRFAEDKGIVQ